MKYLADHGATVIRVESYSRGDPARSVAPFKDMKAGFNRSQFPANFNTKVPWTQKRRIQVQGTQVQGNCSRRVSQA